MLPSTPWKPHSVPIKTGNELETVHQRSTTARGSEVHMQMALEVQDHAVCTARALGTTAHQTAGARSWHNSCLLG